MKQFRYQAKKGSDLIKGILFSETEEDAAESISGMGFSMTEMTEVMMNQRQKENLGEMLLVRFKKGRQCRRIASNSPLAFHVVEYGGSSRLLLPLIGPLLKLEFQGHEKDFSPGGVCFSVADPQRSFEDFKKEWGDFSLADVLEPGSILEIKTVLTGGKGPEDFIAKVQIIRVVYSAEAAVQGGERSVLVGAIFLPMNAENRKLLTAFFETSFGKP